MPRRIDNDEEMPRRRRRGAKAAAIEVEEERGLLMRSYLINRQRVRRKRSDFHKDRIGLRCCKHGILQLGGGKDPLRSRRN